MHGLNIRIEWGKAKVMRIIDQSRASAEKAEVLWEADQCGYHDYALGKNTPPHMFLDEPELVKAWYHGWNFHAKADEMSVCDACQHPHGEPCPVHDAD